jgi:hypothetical protein
LFSCNGDDFEKYCDLLESRRSKIKPLRVLKAKIKDKNKPRKYKGRQLTNFRLWLLLFGDIQKEKEDSKAGEKDTSDIQPKEEEEEDYKANKKVLLETIQGPDLNEICFVGPDISLEKLDKVKEDWAPLQRWFKTRCQRKPTDEDRKDLIRDEVIKSERKRKEFDEEWDKWTNNFSKTILAPYSGGALGGIGPGTYGAPPRMQCLLIEQNRTVITDDPPRPRRKKSSNWPKLTIEDSRT